MLSSKQIGKMLDEWLRRDAVNVRAALVRQYDSVWFDGIEDAIQYALLKALELWPFQGVPEAPGAWLHLVASRRLLDIIRRQDVRDRCSDEMWRESNVGMPEPGEADVELMYLCCDPALSPKQRLALILSLGCEMTTSEIASQLLLDRRTVQQRLVRAKNILRSLEAPRPPDALHERLHDVLDALYVLFNEGYDPSHGSASVRAPLCMHACRLSLILLKDSRTSTPDTYALAALLHLCGARLGARADASGWFIPWRAQDRACWDHRMLRLGLSMLPLAAQGSAPSRYHVLALLEARRMSAETFEEIDWEGMRETYDVLIAMEDTPVYRLNRAVVSLMRGHYDEARQDVEVARGHAHVQAYPYVHAVHARLLEAQGDLDGSIVAWTDAAHRVRNQSQAQWIDEECSRLTHLRDALR